MAKLVKKISGPAERGIGVGISRIESSDAGLSTFGIMGRMGSIVADELARVAVGVPLLLQGRGKEGVDSASLRRWGNSVELPDTRLPVTSREAACERLG